MPTRRRPALRLFGPLLTHELSCGHRKPDAPIACDTRENLFPRWARRLALQKFLDVRRERLATGLRSPHELAVKALGDVSHLDHLAHARSVAHVLHMCNIGACLRS